MEDHKIREILNKYWEGESSLEEEKDLHSYFASSQVSDEFVAFIPLFAYFDQEKHVQMEAKITHQPQEKKGSIVHMNWLIKIAASVAILISMFFLFDKSDENTKQQYAYEDTYQTPEEAYEEVKQALMYVSAKMNRGVTTAAQSLERMEPLDRIIN